MKTSKLIKVAVIGCSNFAVKHMDAYLKNPQAELVGVVDLNHTLAKLRGEQFDVPYYTSLHKMLDEASPQACSIFTPPTTQKKIINELLKSNIAILCEKPLGTSSSEAKEISEHVQKNNAIFLVGFCYRFCQLINKAYSLIQKGVIGQVVFCTTKFGSRILFEGTWREKKELGGGFLRDSMIHFFDLFHWFFGDIDRVCGNISTTKPEIEVEDTASVMIVFKNGVSCLFNGSWVTPSTSCVISIEGDKGTIEIIYPKEGTNYLVLRTEQYEEKIIVENKLDRFHNEINHFLQCVSGEVEPLVGGSVAVHAHQIVEAIYKSVEKNNWFKYDR